MVNARNNSARLPVGVRDYLPQAARGRQQVLDTLHDEFKDWGFERIETPMIELAEAMDRGLGPDERSVVVRFVEPATGEVACLRPDITPQVARLAATHLTKPTRATRWSYSGTVARLSRAAHGRREILQAGVELYGVSGPVGDVEIVGLAAAALARVGAGQSRIDLGHVAFTKLVLEEIADDRRQELAHLLARKDRAGLLAISRSLPARMRTLVIELGELYGPADEVVKRARRLSLPRPLALALRELEEVLRRAQRKLPGNQYRGISVDLGEVRGRGYYTGLRIAGYVGGAGGAVVRGGRYDELVSRYGTPVPAVGMAIDVDMLAEALAKEGIVR